MPLRDLLKRDPSLSRSRLEALMSLASGAVAEPAAGIAGLYGLVRGGADEGVRMIDKVRGKLTYAPRDPRGQQEVGRALSPLTKLLDRSRSAMGDATYNATGSPVASAAAYAAPDALLSVLGYRPAVAGAQRAAQGVRSGIETATSGPAMGGAFAQDGMIAYHGTPHRFPPAPDNELGAFDMSKLGSGDGGQARGVGINLTDTPDVSRWFQNRRPDVEGGGAVYTVDVPDEAVANFLDWDKPLHQQPEAVQRALADYGWAQDEMTGGEFMRALGYDYSPSPAEASRRLLANGIPGVRYSGRRFEGANENTNNYVVFDEKLPKIVGRE